MRGRFIYKVFVHMCIWYLKLPTGIIQYTHEYSMEMNKHTPKIRSSHLHHSNLVDWLLLFLVANGRCVMFGVTILPWINSNDVPVQCISCERARIRFHLYFFTPHTAIAYCRKTTCYAEKFNGRQKNTRILTSNEWVFLWRELAAWIFSFAYLLDTKKPAIDRFHIYICR